MKYLSKIEEELAQKFKDHLRNKLGNEIVLINLFGSKARGDFHKESDIDILVVLRQPTEKQIDFIYDTAMIVAMASGIYLSVKIFSEEEFNYYRSIPTRFIKNVLEEGVALI